MRLVLIFFLVNFITIGFANNIALPCYGCHMSNYSKSNNSDFSSPLSDLSVTEWNKTNVNTNEMANLHGSIISSGTYYFRVRARGAGLVGTYTSKFPEGYESWGLKIKKYGQDEN